MTPLTWHNTRIGEPVWVLYRGEWLASTVNRVDHKTVTAGILNDKGRFESRRFPYANIQPRKGNDRPD